MIVNYEGKEIKLPDFLIVGAAKSGTTSLHYYLQSYPEIFMTAGKEPWFFSYVNNPPNYCYPEKFSVIWKLEDYIDLFKESKTTQLIGEASPSYLYTHNQTIKNIKDVYGDNYQKLQIIIILRNPVKRAYSQFMMFKRDELEPLDFEQATSLETIKERMRKNWNIFYDYIGFGLYYTQVRSFMDEFPDVKILFYDDLVKDERKVVQDLCNFLKVDFRDDIKLGKFNKSGVPRINFINNLLATPSPLKEFIKSVLPYDVRIKIKHKIFELNLKPKELNKKETDYLSSLFSEDICNLSKLLNADLTPWL